VRVMCLGKGVVWSFYAATVQGAGETMGGYPGVRGSRFGIIAKGGGRDVLPGINVWAS